MKKVFYIILAAFLACGFSAQSQDFRRSARKGNRLYDKKNYSEAEIAYRKSLVQDSTFYKSQYNLGNALYKQKRYAEAKKYYQKALESQQINDKERSQGLHNLGNCALQEGLANRGSQDAMKDFQEAVECYKNSLKASGDNSNTKYNLEFAKKMLQQEMQNQQNNKNQQQQNQQNQQQQQQNKDKKDQNKNNQQQNQQQQNKDKKDQDKKDQQQQQQQQQQKEKKKEDAERMLEALKNKEKQTLEKQKVKIPAGGRVEKDW